MQHARPSGKISLGRLLNDGDPDASSPANRHSANTHGFESSSVSKSAGIPGCGHDQVSPPSSMSLPPFPAFQPTSMTRPDPSGRWHTSETIGGSPLFPGGASLPSISEACSLYRTQNPRPSSSSLNIARDFRNELPPRRANVRKHLLEEHRHLDKATASLDHIEGQDAQLSVTRQTDVCHVYTDICKSTQGLRQRRPALQTRTTVADMGSAEQRSQVAKEGESDPQQYQTKAGNRIALHMSESLPQIQAVRLQTKRVLDESHVHGVAQGNLQACSNSRKRFWDGGPESMSLRGETREGHGYDLGRRQRRSLQTGDSFSCHRQVPGTGRIPPRSGLPRLSAPISGSSDFGSIHTGDGYPRATAMGSGTGGGSDCEMCGKHFKTKQGCLRHQQTVHLKQRPYRCDECGSTFGQKCSLQRHQRAVHRRTDIRFKCEHTACNWSFTEYRHLQQHIKAAHNGAPPFRCHVGACTATFMWPSSHRNHIETAHGSIGRSFDDNHPSTANARTQGSTGSIGNRKSEGERPR